MQKIILDFLIKYNSEFYRNYGLGNSHLIPLSHELADQINKHLANNYIPTPIPVPTIERYEPEPPFTPTTIINIVGEVLGVDPADIQNNCQFRLYVEPRHFAFYFIHEFFPKLSYREIRLLFTGRGMFGLNHSTIIKAITKVRNFCENDKKFLKTFKIIEGKIKNIK